MSGLPFEPNPPVDPAVATPGEPEEPAPGQTDPAPEPPAPPSTSDDITAGDPSLIPEAFKQQEAQSLDAKEKNPYWIGLLPSAGYWYIPIGGVTFHRMTEKVEGPDLADRRAGAGQKVMLSDQQVANIKRAIAALVIRPRGNGSALLIQTTNPRTPYIRQQGDSPLAQHVYMKRLSKDPNVAPEYPEPLVAASQE